MKKRVLFLLLIILTVFLLSSCVPGDGTSSISKPAGFFWGVWHGWIAPVSLIMELFNGKYSIYEAFNNGWWYNFGFYIAIISGFGGLSLIRRKKKDK